MKALLGLLVATTVLAEPAKPSDRARQLLTQLTSDTSAPVPELAADAIVVQRYKQIELGQVGERLGKVDKQVEGATADVGWFVADLTQPYGLLDCPPALAKCHKQRPLRVSGLVAETPKGWQIVAAHVQGFSPGGGDEPSEMPAPTKPDILTKLLADPGLLDAALADDPNVAVLGTDAGERAIGRPAAHKLLASWSKLKLQLAGKSHEVRTAHWGYATGFVDWVRKPDDIFHMRATVYATQSDTGVWHAVVAHYSTNTTQYE